jgi:3-deoxy-D-manno-octulosonic-acid transferase
MFKALDIARMAIGTVAKAAAKVPVVDSRFRINDRLNGPWPEGPFLWLHGASLGECKMLLNLAKFLREDIENCPKILLTTQKTEVLNFIKDSGCDVETCIAPADTPAAMKAFLAAVKPAALILGENELWPGYLSGMKSLSSKPSVAIVSGRYNHSLPGVDFSCVGYASMQTGGDLSRFLNVASRANIAKMMIGGDWKILPWVRSGNQVKAPENPTIDTAFVSMHMAEWASLCRMVVSSIKRQESVVLIPRRLTEVDAFRKALREQELTVVEWPLVQKGAISLISKFGLTKEVYAKSRTAIIGGSFSRGLGVHDFWEPIQMGVATCIGPFAAGQREKAAALVNAGVMAQLQSTAGYAKRVIPDPRVVSTYLSNERTKIADSYEQLLEFLRGLFV